MYGHNGELLPNFITYSTLQNPGSCEQAIVELIGYVLQSKNRNEHSASVYLDSSKAFDTLDHAILLKKLEWYGI